MTKPHWGQWILKRSQLVGLTSQRALSREVGVTPKIISKWINSANPPKLRKTSLENLSKALNSDENLIIHGYIYQGPEVELYNSNDTIYRNELSSIPTPSLREELKERFGQYRFELLSRFNQMKLINWSKSLSMACSVSVNKEFENYDILVLSCYFANSFVSDVENSISLYDVMADEHNGIRVLIRGGNDLEIKKDFLDKISKRLNEAISRRLAKGPVAVQIVECFSQELETNLYEWIENNQDFKRFQKLIMIRNAYDLNVIDFEKAEEGRKEILQEISASTSQI